MKSYGELTFDEEIEAEHLKEINKALFPYFKELTNEIVDKLKANIKGLEINILGLEGERIIAHVSEIYGIEVDQKFSMNLYEIMRLNNRITNPEMREYLKHEIYYELFYKIRKFWENLILKEE